MSGRTGTLATTHRSAVPGRLLTQGLPILLFVAVLCASAFTEAHQLTSLTGTSVWRELRIGTWIVEHRAVPRTGIYSTETSTPWADPSWGSEVLRAAAYKVAGLRSIPIWTILLRALFGAATFLLGGAYRGRLWRALLLSGAAQLALFHEPSQQPLLSALLYCVVLALLRPADGVEGSRILWGIPFLLLLWSNLDSRVVVGVFAVVLYFANDLLTTRVHKGLGLRNAGLLMLASVIAPLLSPYGVNVYNVASARWMAAFSLDWTGQNVGIYPREILSMDFRSVSHYVLMLLTMTALLALGKVGRDQVWKPLLLLATAFLGFCIHLESWAVVATAVALLGTTQLSRNDERTAVAPRMMVPLTIAVAIVVTAIACMRIPAESRMAEVVSTAYPWRAANFIRENRLPGPVYNELIDGDFLMWALPEYAISIDTRTELYGVQEIQEGMNATRGQIRPVDSVRYNQAETVILTTKSPVIIVAKRYRDQTVFQRSLPACKLVYQDDQAVVCTKLH